MRRKIGTLCMILGAASLLAALSLFAYNQWDSMRAGQAAAEALEKVMEAIDEREDSETGTESDTDTAETNAVQEGVFEEDITLTEVEIDGYYYIGYLSIPALDLELPVMSEWDYTRLKIAPCRYSGSPLPDNLVVCAHNNRHFKDIKNLSTGDAVIFTDMDGRKYYYEVVDLVTLAPTAVEEMTDSGYALTMFTCTYGGQSRVTVRCDRVD